MGGGSVGCVSIRVGSVRGLLDTVRGVWLGIRSSGPGTVLGCVPRVGTCRNGGMGRFVSSVFRPVLAVLLRLSVCRVCRVCSIMGILRNA